ncbi:transaldolase [Azospirillum sp. TSO22-1]|uniref:transaldolase n=1 Tax=Azospirillum sp. TSO22-1 TaxID=716789 RepID=UPI000D60A906|nr:transaldolase [Azospirillum sp. TSO22-1]PWC55353.1 transaldolase [Azospirillum sp. TSO22-1]
MPLTRFQDLKVKLFADGADLASIADLAAKPYIAGFTTNPTLMRKSGVSDYVAFAHEMLGIVGGRPVSFEVFADDLDTMKAQARTIASWGPNVYVKIPVTNSEGVSCAPLIAELSAQGVQLNVTAILTLDQVQMVAGALDPATPAVVSVFAGRIADAGVDPMGVMADALGILARRPKAELLWASPRELFNVVQADAVGCQIITVPPDLLGKLPLIGKNLTAYSLETVQMFRRDAVAAGYDIPGTA